MSRWLGELAEAGRAPGYVNDLLRRAKTFLRWAIERNYLRESPLAGIKPSKGGPGSRVYVRRALTIEEVRAVVASAASKGATGPLRAVAYQVTAFSGFRRIELQRLIREDCTPTGPRPRWHVRPEVTKNGSAANLPMTPECAAALLPLWLATPPGALLFPRGLHEESFERDRVTAGVAKKDERGRVADYHSLRYTFCALMARTQPIEVVSKLMRHSSLDLTTQIYLDLGLDRIGEGEWVLPPLLPQPPARAEGAA
jgi:integrase